MNFQAYSRIYFVMLLLLQHLSFLQKYLSNFERILDQFREYKQAVPTFGAILLNEDLTNVSLLLLLSHFMLLTK